MLGDRSARLAAWLAIGAAAILTAAQWPVLPYFLDSYYHLSVIQGFRDAGGPVLHAFWEAAPEGRPHLYPPGFHLIFLPLAQLGLDPIFLARLWSWAAMPALLAAAWLALSRIFGPPKAALTLAALATPYSFFLSAVNNLPATGVLVCTLGLMLALFKRRWAAGGILLGFSFWLHAGLPWLAALSLLIFAGIEPSYRKTSLRVLFLGILLAGPWLLHSVGHANLLQLQPRGEERFLEFPVIPLALGTAGFFLSLTAKGMERFPAALAVGFGPMLAGYRFRFFAAQGLFPWLLLAGLALAALASRLKSARLLFGLLAGLALASPTLFYSQGSARWAFADTTFTQLAGWAKAPERPFARTIFNAKLMNELANRVKALAGPDELIYSNFPYVSGLMNVLTGRATTNRMLREMADVHPLLEIERARVIVWIKPADGSEPAELNRIARKLGLIPAGETPIAYLLTNPKAAGSRRIPKAFCPGWLAVGIMGLAAGWALWDLRRSPGA